MISERVKDLLIQAENNASDCFLKYALAMEFQKINELESAIEWFKKAFECDNKNYNSLFMIGKIYERQNEIEQAIAHFGDCKKMALANNDRKTAGEAQTKLDDLSDE